MIYKINIKCQFCNNIEERSNEIKTITCFECKRKLQKIRYINRKLSTAKHLQNKDKDI